MLNDKIDTLENKGRDKFRKLCENKHLQFVESTERLEYFDGIVYFKGKKYLIEIKDRSEKFNYDTILFEKDKYDNLIKSIDKEQADGAYYVSFWDNVAYIYLIPREMNLKPYKINANKCTAINDDKKEKLVYFINKNDVKRYTI